MISHIITITGFVYISYHWTGERWRQRLLVLQQIPPTPHWIKNTRPLPLPALGRQPVRHYAILWPCSVLYCLPFVQLCRSVNFRFSFVKFCYFVKVIHVLNLGPENLEKNWKNKFFFEKKKKSFKWTWKYLCWIFWVHPSWLVTKMNNFCSYSAHLKRFPIHFYCRRARVWQIGRASCRERV